MTACAAAVPKDTAACAVARPAIAADAYIFKANNSNAAGATSSQLPHLNTFIERSAIDAWSQHLDLSVVEFIAGPDKRWSGQALGQSLAVLEKSTIR